VKHIKSIIAIVVVTVIAGMLVWHLMWMKEVKSTSNVKQLIDEADQIAGVTDHKFGDDKKEISNKGYVAEVKPIISDQESQPEIEQMEEPQQEKDTPEEISVKPEAAQTDIAIPALEETYDDRVDSISREEADREQKNQQLQSDVNKVKRITIKGSSQIITAKQPDAIVTSPVQHPTSPAQHPTSTAP